jgi:hypothetical protein
MTVKQSAVILIVAALSIVLGVPGNVKSRQGGSRILATDQVTIPQLLNYQGKLTDTAGHPVPNGQYAVTFSLYAESIGGSAFWTELQSVQTRSGLFNVLLGSASPLTYIPWDGNCWLEMQVVPGPALTPRVRIVSAAYSYFSAVAETAMAAGRAAAARPLVPGVDSTEIRASMVTSSRIKDRTIKGIDIAIPCSLVSQVGNPYAALHIKSQNTGNGIRIDSAANNGIVVYYANSAGLLIDSAAGNGVNVYAAGTDGIYVARAHTRGLRVDKAGNYGVAAYGMSGGGYFEADTFAGVGIVARSFNAVATDTAIHAEGRCIASGGWYTGFDDGGGAPCAVSPERTIIAYGTARVSSGVIRYPDVFVHNIRSDIPVRINLTPKGNPAGMLYVSSTDAAGFSVALKHVPGWDGDSDATFDWVAFGTLREPSSAPGPKPPYERVPVKGSSHD